jgi:hypothetical protein
MLIIVTDHDAITLKQDERARNGSTHCIVAFAAEVFHTHGKQRNLIRDSESFYPKTNKRYQRELCTEKKFIQMRLCKLCAISNSVAMPKPF